MHPRLYRAMRAGHDLLVAAYDIDQAHKAIHAAGFTVVNDYDVFAVGVIGPELRELAGLAVAKPGTVVEVSQ